MYRACPVCNGIDVVPSISRAKIPLLQNRVYDTKKEAVAAAWGRLTLCTCGRCGFSYNGEFDERHIIYDQHYNNDVSSQVFELYSEQIARHLIKKFGLTSGTVYDVGCGKGTFLRILCRLAPGINGIGIDPSCTPTVEDNFTLIQDVFHSSSFQADTKLVLLRHVLEHITMPVEFLTELGKAAPNIPLYVEVPELGWIFENGAFWDFCYEHCNYFSPDSLRTTLQLAGFSDIEQSSSFGGQYQWAIATANGVAATVSSIGADAIKLAQSYSASESVEMEKVQATISSSGSTAIWGMATKGVILSCLLGDKVVTNGIDINGKKQEKFAPLSGVQIHAPEWLKANPAETILVMNSNYEGEIREALRQLGVGSKIVVM
ncbi:methyltransferase domain-containing protein [Sinorhizobium meliloti]|uniref:class I SAM-dependent methyltransferase n=1 Tax=Rhizobium meliloti TaxID=382 RepID=UPI00129770D9|nr:class I SAM-dependent methyltransferase [Sinorhizobium meliloti]MDW9592867.1 methyltransferase domain-containing protein [Sinorhizobium meliloti]MQV09169.1 methyltransferase domain-containing protein [Sinorhizobium meliloti]MQV63339.1 methyltransferase domain-containing protein [Sinorhizobium meliloti]